MGAAARSSAHPKEGISIRVAAVQLNSTADLDRNLEVAEAGVRRAASRGAELAVLPEKWTVLGSAEVLVAGAEPLDGPSLSAAGSWARELGLWLVAGSIVERDPGGTLHNTSCLIGPDGAVVARYRKLHMFDVDVAGVSYRESATEQPGDEVVLADADRLPLGLSICFDLRYPELYRILAVRGALAFAVPSAFTLETGRDHWEVLLRARAIENQAFVIAAGQIGTAPPHFNSYGRSMVIDPWGTVLACAPDESGAVAVAELDLDRQAELRRTLPSLANRRPDAYAWPDEVPA